MRICIVGFHRRFDTEFMKAKETILSRIKEKNQLPTHIKISSHDPIWTNHNSFVKADLLRTMQQSCCHDVDMSHFLLDSECDIKFTNTIPLPHSGSLTTGDIIYKDGRVVPLTISYRRENSHFYLQTAEIFYGEEHLTFGHNFDISKSTSKHKSIFGSEVYTQAYIDQYSYFYKLIKGEAYNPNLLRSYQKTFQLWDDMLENAARCYDKLEAEGKIPK